ncbi:MAG: 2-oxoacid:acceptor oxidoreductase family protein, partial [Candidatus Eisenbacteria bacterium]|nr:2-oxoacid:acceptor oxidoreductase family protein [Candidatus Eisenbacteria bacterium]
FDYGSLIRGGHNFSIVRAAPQKVAAHRDSVDFVLALDQTTLDLHRSRLNNPANVVFDSDAVRADAAPAGGIGLPLRKILQEEAAKPVMRNSCLVGAFARCISMDLQTLERLLREHVRKATDQNVKLASRGYELSREATKLEALSQAPLPTLTGNEATGLGLVAAGLKTYIAYPMTPSSSLLHFLADVAQDFSLKVIHPENEIAVMLMALGFSYAGDRVAVGTSGGGFCLMTEGLSLAGGAELPVVVFVGQRPSPSTGLPTYTAQAELNFVLSAGHGEFVRFVVAPGDPEEAFYWSKVAMDVAWKYQIPSIILSDKTLSEGGLTFDVAETRPAGEPAEARPFLGPVLWDGTGAYARYAGAGRSESAEAEENAHAGPSAGGGGGGTAPAAGREGARGTGISPLAFPPAKGAVIKVNSYEHDERGITTEEAAETSKMYEKRLRKGTYLAQEMEGYEAVRVHARRDSDTALLCWGSNKGVCVEVGDELGLRVVQPVVLSPFPVRQFESAVRGVRKLVSVENNATGQMASLVKSHGFGVHGCVCKFDGRPFSCEELETELKKLL